MRKLALGRLSPLNPLKPMKPMRSLKPLKPLCLALAVVVVAPSTTLGSEELAERLAKIEAPRALDERGPGYGDDALAHAAFTLEQLMAATRTPALSIAIWEGEAIVAMAWGLSDADTGQPATPSTLFQAASISKPVFAMAVLRSVEMGRLTLDAPVDTWLDGFELPTGSQTETERVTPRRLLSHSAGTTIHGFPGYGMGARIPTVPEVLAGVKPANTGAVVVDVLPGSLERYSGGGTTLMQLAMADLLQRPVAEIVSELVLAPAGATSSGYLQPLPEDRWAEAARAHIRGKRHDDQWHIYPELAAAGLWTTPTDLARIAIDVQQSIAGDLNRVLAPSTARLSTLPVGPAPLESAGTRRIELVLTRRPTLRSGTSATAAATGVSGATWSPGVRAIVTMATSP